MWSMNIVLNIDMCQPLHSKPYRAPNSSPLQRLLDPVNYPLIHMIGPAMMRNTQRLTMWPRRHPDEVITTLTQWRLVVHFVYRTYPTGGANDGKRTPRTLISPMLHAICSISYHMESEWRPGFPLGKMSLTGGSRKQQARPFMKKSFWGCLLEPILGSWWEITQYPIQRTWKTTRKWTKSQRKGNCTEWPRFTTFWICGRAARTYMLHRRNLVIKTNKWQLLDTFQTPKRSSKPPGHSFDMMVWVHLNCQKDHLCHQLWLQRTCLEDELGSWMSTESWESTVIQSKMSRIAHLKALQTLKIGWTGMVTSIIQMTAETIAWQMMNQIWSTTTASSFRNAQSSRMWVPRQMFPDWFDQHGSQTDWLKWCWSRSMQ